MFIVLRAALLPPLVPSLLLALSVALPAQPAAARPADIANVAHRGASDHAPENTVPAMVEAVADRADFVGIDIRLTRDGVPVVIHDATLRRTTNAETRYPHRAPWAVEQLSLAEIGRLDAGGWKGPGYRGARIPTLERVLGELATSGTGLFLEIKDPDRYGGASGIGDAVRQVLRRHPHWRASLEGRHDDLVLQSFDWGFLHRLALREPFATYGLLGKVTASDLDRRPEASQVNMPFDSVTAARVDEMHRREVSVAAFTATTPGIMRDMIEVGVDAIVANDPALLHDQLARRGVARPRTNLDPDGLGDATWSVNAPERARAGSAIRFEARLRLADGSPAAWQWAELQRRTRDGWHTLRRRATAADGEFWAKAPAAATYRVRLRDMPAVATRHDVTLVR
jgi:glycerophosphoryl diester phosphodiesterase